MFFSLPSIFLAQLSAGFFTLPLDATGHFPRPARRNAYCNLSPGGLAAEKCGSGPHFRGGTDKERANDQLLQVNTRIRAGKRPRPGKRKEQRTLARCSVALYPSPRYFAYKSNS